MAEEISLRQDFIPVIRGGACIDRPFLRTGTNPPAEFHRPLEGGRVLEYEEYVLHRVVEAVPGVGSFVFYYYIPQKQSPQEQVRSARRAQILAGEQVRHLIECSKAENPEEAL